MFLEDFSRDFLLHENVAIDHETIKKCKPITMQIVSFSSTMEPYEENSPTGYLSMTQEPADARPRLVPQIIGVTEHGASILINVYGFATFFLARCPETWKKSHTSHLETALRNALGSNKTHLRKVEYIKNRSFRGWTNYKEFGYIKIYCDNDKVTRTLQLLCKNGIVIPELGKHKISFSLADTKIESILKFIHITDIETGGWIKIKHYNLCETELPKTSHVVNINIEDIKKIVNPNKAAIVKLSWDIEVNSHDGHSFPNAKLKEDRLFQISSNFRVEGTQQSKLKVLLTLKKCDPIKPVEALPDHVPESLAKGTHVVVAEFEKESELIRAWISLVNRMDPDYIYGFNTFGFDHEYLAERALYLDGGDPNDPRTLETKINHMGSRPGSLVYGLLNMGRTNKPSSWFNKPLASSALGHRNMSYNPMPGRIIFDVMHAILTVKILDQYSLDFCAKTILGTNKKDLPAPEIFARYKDGRPCDIKMIGVYCIVDSELPHDLVDKLNIIWANAAVATVSSVPQEYIYIRGQSIKIGSYCSKACREKGIAFDDVPPCDKKRYEKWYEGAYVMNAQPQYYDDVVYVCDFNSLYPSEEISHDLSQDTLVEINGEYDHMPNVRYIDFDIPVKRLVPNFPEFADKKTGKKERAKEVAAALELKNKNKLRLLEDLESACEKEDGSMLVLTHDAGDYGIDGENAGTTKERDQDKKIKKVTPQQIIDALWAHYKLYGANFSMLENNNETTVAPPKEKEKPEDIVKEENKFTKKLKEVQTDFPTFVSLRHELDGLLAKDRSFGLASNYGGLPDDLLDAKIPVSKAKIVITTRRVRFASVPEHKGILPEILVNILLARAETREKIKYNNFRIKRHEKRIAGEFDHDEAIKKLIAKVSSEKKWSETFRAEMTANLKFETSANYKEYSLEKLKEEIKLWKKENSNYENLQNAFKVTANSFYGQCGSFFSMIYCVEVAAATTTAGQQDIKHAADVVERLYPGDEVIYGDTDSIFVVARLPQIKAKWKKYKMSDEDIAGLPRFFANKELLEYKRKEEKKGNIVVITEALIEERIASYNSEQKNNFMKKYIQEKMDEELIRTGMQHAIESAKAINAAINRPPMNIEFEKVIYPYIQFTPKRYKGFYHTDPDNPLAYEIKTMGLVDKKRDNCEYTRKCFRELTEALLSLTPHEKIIEMFKRQVENLLDGNVDTRDLVITKKIGQSYKLKPPAHVLCANRLKERNYSIQYHVNDRIPYIISLTEDLSIPRPMSKAPKVEEMAEEFNYAVEYNIPINYLYYLSNVCLSPLLDTMFLITDNPIELLNSVVREYDTPKWLRVKWGGNTYPIT